MRERKRIKRPREFDPTSLERGVMTGSEIETSLDPSETLLTKKELAVRLRRSVRTVDAWVKLKRLPHLRIGRAILFRWATVVEFLEEKFGVRSS
jgi:excisionase family DNA binding protein